MRVPDHGGLCPWRFIVLENAGKAYFAVQLEILALSRKEPASAKKLQKLRNPPLAIVVVSSPRLCNIPEWEQILSAGAVCTTLLFAATAAGFGANWITDWYSYDDQARSLLRLSPTERIAGFILIGAPRQHPLERLRPDPTQLTTRLEAADAGSA